MTQAFNLSQFANKLNSSGQADSTALQSGTYGINISGNANTATTATTATTASSVTNGVYTTAFVNSLSTNGYQKIQGGLIVQWGTTSTSSGGITTVNFPIAFPNSCLSFQVSLNQSSPTRLAPFVDFGSRTTTTINVGVARFGDAF